MKNAIREHSKEDGINEEKVNVVTNMLKDNLDINLISKYTNLDLQKILEIKKTMEDNCD